MRRGPKARPIEDRFWAKVRKAGAVECWLWTGAKAGGGYGLIWNGSGPIGTHRLAWEMATGLSARGMVICHRCDTPACVNAAHLFIGTPADNMRDAKRKNRTATGTRNGIAKLTDEKVREIRSLAASGLRQRDIAERFGVSATVVQFAVQRRTWQHVE